MNNMKDLYKVYVESEQVLPKQVYIQGGHIVVNVDYKYNIPLNECDTNERILGWVRQLTQENWITPDVLDRFIALACSHHKIEKSQA